MKYEYTYKTSDGERHVDFIRAKSTEAAFAILRQQGIKPIRVVRAKPVGFIEHILYFISSVSGVSICVAVVAVLISLWVVIYREKEVELKAQDKLYVKTLSFEKLAADVELVQKAHEEAYKLLDFELLRNYALISKLKDLQPLYAEISKGKLIIANTRERLRVLFSSVPKEFAHDKKGFVAAQALYGSVMATVDLDEAQVQSEEAVIALLDENRDKWKVVKGKIVFSDESLRADFSLLSQSVDPATARWRKDFGPRNYVESDIITIPETK